MMITVCTPTYNRGYIIEKLYESLKSQSFKNFEWLIIDDGSTDNTEKKIEEFISEKKIDIKYIKQKNGGKHRALNKAIENARGELFFIVDSDDYLPEYSLEEIKNWFEILKNDKTTKQFIGVSGSRMFNSGEIIGTCYKKDFVDTDYLTYRKKMKIKGDKAEVFYTDILKKYRFLEYENENFLTEATLWNKIAKDGYILRWYNKPIYICEYLEDGLTKNISEKISKNWEGTKYFLFQEISSEYKSSLKHRILNIGYYIKIGMSNNYKLRELNKEVLKKTDINKLESIIGTILGMSVYYRNVILEKILKMVKNED